MHRCPGYKPDIIHTYDPLSTTRRRVPKHRASSEPCINMDVFKNLTTMILNNDNVNNKEEEENGQATHILKKLRI